MDYDLLNWVDDQDITADKLNHMDSGIKSANDDLSEKADKTELNGYIPNSEKGVSVATLVEGKIPTSQLPNSTITNYVKSVTAKETNTITVTKGDGSSENITIDNVAQATKSEQDSNGNVINNTYLNMETGEYMGEYLLVRNPKGILRIKNGTASVKDGLGFYISSDKFYFFDWYLDKAIISIDKNIGYPQVPTLPISSNSLAVANSAFVKAQSAGSDISLLNGLNQCYKKDPSGLIHQFIEIQATTEEIDVQFPISFPERCLFVGVEILNPQKDNAINEIKFETIEKTLDSVKLLKIGTGTPTISVMAVGI